MARVSTGRGLINKYVPWTGGGESLGPSISIANSSSLVYLYHECMQQRNITSRFTNTVTDDALNSLNTMGMVIAVVNHTIDESQ